MKRFYGIFVLLGILVYLSACAGKPQKPVAKEQDKQRLTYWFRLVVEASPGVDKPVTHRWELTWVEAHGRGNVLFSKISPEGQREIYIGEIVAEEAKMMIKEYKEKGIFELKDAGTPVGLDALNVTTLYIVDVSEHGRDNKFRLYEYPDKVEQYHKRLIEQISDFIQVHAREKIT